MPITRTRDYDPNVPVSAGGRSGEGVVRTASGEEIRFTPQEAMPQPQPQQIQDPQEAMPQGQGFQIPPQLQNRNEYESFLQSKYGDPWEDERNLDKLISDTTSQNEREAFEQVFGGQYRYEDRSQLSKKAQDHWHDSLLMLRKNVETQQKQDIEVRKDQMGEQMKVFDNYVKMFKPDKPDRPRYGIKTVVDMIQKIKERGTPITNDEMIGLEEMTRDMQGISVGHKIVQEAKREGIFGEGESKNIPILSWINDLWPDIPEIAELKIQRKSGTSIKDSADNWQSDPSTIRQKFKAGEINREEAKKLLQKVGM